MLCDPLTPIVIKTLDCFYLHDLVLNDDDDDIQDAYCKLYKFHVRFVKDKFIAKLDETNKLNENFKNQISSQVDKIKSLEQQLVEFKNEVEKLTSAKFVVGPNSKERFLYSSI